MKTIREKFETTAIELNEALVEREAEIEVVLTALVSDEHVLLVGTPGEAKSLLLDSIVDWTHGKKFKVTLNGQSTLGDIYGPIAISQLKLDRHIRATAGKFPECDFANLEEVFNGNTAVANSLHRGLNEREYEKGDGTFGPIPLKMAVGSTNRWPDVNDNLDAFFDRFLFRLEVKRVISTTGLSQLAFGGDHIPRLSTSLSLEELDQARKEAKALPWSESAKEALVTIARELSDAGIAVSSRRLVKSKKAAQASAWLDGAEQVETEHLAILQHVLWSDPAKELRTKSATVILKHANPVAVKVNGFCEEAEKIAALVVKGNLSSARVAKTKLLEIVRQLNQIKSRKAEEAAKKWMAESKRIGTEAVQDALKS